MVFTSYIFLLGFLPAVLLVYYGLHATRKPLLRTAWLTLASYAFYGWDRLDYLGLILASTLLDSYCGRIVAVADHPRRKLALMASVAGNLGLLGYFKYFNFGLDSANALLDLFGASPIQYAKVALPVGISFYTFQTMSYTIDIYRGEARKARSFLHLACYVALFPQLVAGPIVRYRDLDEQLERRLHTLERFGRGALLFMIGFAKKILIADSAGRLAEASIDPGGGGALLAWVSLVAYTVQIYFDFSGYSDMAIGLGRMFGFEFPLNFASPYRSKSITEFWRRWHISLSTWLRDYLYIPLGGNRKGPGRTYVHLLITMLLGGLWHGAQWTFVAWGVFHGGLLALERWTGKRAPWAALPAPLQVAFTFVLVMIGWVFFRAADFGEATGQLAAMAGGFGAGDHWSLLRAASPLDLGLACLGLVLCFAGIQSDRLVSESRPLPQVAVSAFVLATFLTAVGHMFFQSYSPFLYFQF